jgi:hypothetical protein
VFSITPTRIAEHLTMVRKVVFRLASPAGTPGPRRQDLARRRRLGLEVIVLATADDRS